MTQLLKNGMRVKGGDTGGSYTRPATDKQVRILVRLGYDVNWAEGLTSWEAWNAINSNKVK